MEHIDRLVFLTPGMWLLIAARTKKLVLEVMPGRGLLLLFTPCVATVGDTVTIL